MAWAVGNVGTAVFANNADVTPVLPAHNEGDIIIIPACIRSTSPTGARVTETSGTWTQLEDDEGVSIWGKVAGAAEGDPTFQFSGGSAGDTTGAVAFQTTGGSLNIEGTPIVSDNANATDVTFGALTIDEECLVIDFACVNNNLSFNNTSGWTEIVDAGTTTGNDIQMGVQHKTVSVSTSSHVGTISSSTGSQTLSIALQLAAAGGVVIPRRRRM